MTHITDMVFIQQSHVTHITLRVLKFLALLYFLFSLWTEFYFLHDSTCVDFP